MQIPSWTNVAVDAILVVFVLVVMWIIVHVDR